MRKEQFARNGVIGNLVQVSPRANLMRLLHSLYGRTRLVAQNLRIQTDGRVWFVLDAVIERLDNVSLNVGVRGNMRNTERRSSSESSDRPFPEHRSQRQSSREHRQGAYADLTPNVSSIALPSQAKTTLHRWKAEDHGLRRTLRNSSDCAMTSFRSGSLVTLWIGVRRRSSSD